MVGDIHFKDESAIKVLPYACGSLDASASFSFLLAFLGFALPVFELWMCTYFGYYKTPHLIWPLSIISLLLFFLKLLFVLLLLPFVHVISSECFPGVQSPHFPACCLFSFRCLLAKEMYEIPPKVNLNWYQLLHCNTYSIYPVHELHDCLYQRLHLGLLFQESETCVVV